MDNIQKLAGTVVVAAALAACSTTSNSWRNHYDSSMRAPDTPAYVLPMPGTYTPPAAAITATPDKLEGNQMPATGGPTK
jgi:hypothetical protein